MFWFTRVPTTGHLFVRFRGSSSKAIYSIILLSDSPSNILLSSFWFSTYVLATYQQNCSTDTNFITVFPPFRLCFFPPTFFPSLPRYLFISLHRNLCLHTFSSSIPTLQLFPKPTTLYLNFVFSLSLLPCPPSHIASIPQILLSLTFTPPIFPISGSLPVPFPCFYYHDAEWPLFNSGINSTNIFTPNSHQPVVLPLSAIPWLIKLHFHNSCHIFVTFDSLTLCPKSFFTSFCPGAKQLCQKDQQYWRCSPSKSL